MPVSVTICMMNSNQTIFVSFKRSPQRASRKTFKAAAQAAQFIPTPPFAPVTRQIFGSSRNSVELGMKCHERDDLCQFAAILLATDHALTRGSHRDSAKSGRLMPRIIEQFTRRCGFRQDDGTHLERAIAKCDTGSGCLLQVAQPV